MKLYILIGAIGLSFLLFGCKSHNETHEHDEYNEMESNPNQVSFCSNKAKELGFQTQKIEPTPFHQVIKTSGKIVAAQGKETTVASTMTGIVNLSNNIIEGVE
ncbi:MAG: efflux transporter periplasmic adaptor subunit, partial [Bacteroides sp.]|nr:efflux transporter periplasmic adaptor subunit [Bacteroides sp.]